MPFISAISRALCASAITAVTCFAVNAFPFKIWQTDAPETSDASSSTDPKFYERPGSSLTPFIYDLQDGKRDRKTSEEWTIPANHGTKNKRDEKTSACPIASNYAYKPENYVVWNSNTLDVHADASSKKTKQPKKKTPTTTAAAAKSSSVKKSAPTTPVSIEIHPQKPISPISNSPEYKTVRKCSISGHALRPRSLGAAFSTAAISKAPMTAVQRRGKPRRPQNFNSNRNMYR